MARRRNRILRGTGGGFSAQPEVTYNGNVALVGHSLVSPTMPQIFSQVFPDATVNYQVINGSPLFYNWDNHLTAEGTSVRNLLATGVVDHLILTEGGPIEGNISGNDTRGWLQTWRNQGWNVNPAQRTMWYEIWPPIPDWSTTPDWATWQSEIARLATEAYGVVVQQIASDLGGEKIFLSPAGEALSVLYDEVQLGNVPGVSDFKASFFPGDDIHITALGMYFITMVHFATMTGTTPVGLPWNLPMAISGLTSANALAMQNIAWSVVSTHPYAGVATWPGESAGTVTISAPVLMSVSSGSPGTWGGTINTGAARSGRMASVIVAHRYNATVSGVTVGGTALTEQGNVGGTSYRGIWAGPLPDIMAGTQTIAITTDTGERYETIAVAHLLEGVATYEYDDAFNGDNIPLVGEGGDGFVYLFLSGNTPAVTPPFDFNATYYEHPDSSFTQFQYGDGVYPTVTNANLNTVSGFATKIALRLAK